MDDPGKAPSGGSGEPLFTSLRRRRRSQGPPWGTIAALVLLAVAAGGAWYWFRMRTDDEADVASETPVASEDTIAAPAVPEVEPLDLPELDASDALVRDAVAGLSSHPRLARWLVTDDLVRRFVTSVVNIAVGASPASHLGFMAPEGRFEVVESGEALVVDPASYSRYDPIIAAFTSLETDAAARLYRQLHPLFEEAYRELGVPDRTFDETMAAAIGNLLAVEVPASAPVVEPFEAVYRYRDPALEGLSAAAGHLLRLGPDNARRIQAKLRALAGALGIEPRPAEEGGGG